MNPAHRWRYGAFYLSYYAALGAYTPYIGRWLDSEGYSAWIVGATLAIWYGSRIVAPPAWAWAVTRATRPGYLLAGGCLLATLAFLAMEYASGSVTLLVLMIVFGLFFNAVMPQFEAMTLTALGSDAAHYGRIRVWGSIGFLLVAGTFGALLDLLGNAYFIWLSLPLFASCVWTASLHRDDPPPRHVPDTSDAGNLWRRPGVRRFLLVAMLMQIGFAPFYVFYTLHMQASGQTGAAVGSLWAIGVLVEIVLFWLAPQLIARFHPRPLLLLAYAVTAVRWLLTALFAESYALMALAQSTHALGFAMFHACNMRLLAEYFPGRRAAAGQSLLYGFSSGVGGVIGAGMSALAWQTGGGHAAFLAGAAVSALAFVIFLREPTHRDHA